MKIRGNTVGTPMKPEKVVEKAGGGGSTMIVTLNGSTASKNSGQIYNHVASGGNVILRIPIGNDIWHYVNLSHTYPYCSYFLEKNDDYVDSVYIIDESATCQEVTLTPVSPEHLKQYYYTKKEVDKIAQEYGDSLVDLGFASTNYVSEYVDEKIGDISTVLDELHTYAEALKGGGSV